MFFVKFIISVIAVCYLAVNCGTAVVMSPQEMKEHFVDGQCTVGRISAAIFYAPAWLLKAFKRVINWIIK